MHMFVCTLYVPTNMFIALALVAYTVLMHMHCNGPHATHRPREEAHAVMEHEGRGWRVGGQQCEHCMRVRLQSTAAPMLQFISIAL